MKASAFGWELTGRAQNHQTPLCCGGVEVLACSVCSRPHVGQDSRAGHELCWDSSSCLSALNIHTTLEQTLHISMFICHVRALNSVHILLAVGAAESQLCCRVKVASALQLLLSVSAPIDFFLFISESLKTSVAPKLLCLWRDVSRAAGGAATPPPLLPRFCWSTVKDAAVIIYILVFDVHSTVQSSGLAETQFEVISKNSVRNLSSEDGLWSPCLSNTQSLL